MTTSLRPPSKAILLLARQVPTLAFVALVCCFLVPVTAPPAEGVALRPFLWLTLAAAAVLATVTSLARRLQRLSQREKSVWTEGVRCLLLAWCLVWTLSPYASRCLVGGGDAFHYAQQTRDVAQQFAAGVTLPLVGQSDHAFNGDIHPLRTAPALPLSSGLLDWLTGGLLGPVGALNLCLCFSYAGALLLFYTRMRRLYPNFAWEVGLLTALAATQPGLLALLCSGDMMASWFALPGLVLVVTQWAVLLRETREQPLSWLRLATGLAFVWLAHAPLAMWLSVLCALGAVVLLGRRRNWFALRNGVGALGVTALLAGYVFVSVESLDLPSADPNLLSWVRGPHMLGLLREGWSGFLQPMENGGANLLRNLQLSPGLWVALGLGLLGAWRGRHENLPFFLFSVFALLLLLPLPGLNPWLWRLLPDVLINASEKWPMQRLYVLLGFTTPLLFLSVLPWLHTRWPQARGWSLLFFCAALVSSLAEADKLRQRAIRVTSVEAFTETRLRPESALWSRYSHEMFGRLPSTFSHGTVDPLFSFRHLQVRSLVPSRPNDVAVASNADTALVLPCEPADFGFRSTHKLILKHGQSVYVRPVTNGIPLNGVLQLHGRHLYREYPLPLSGEAAAFGVQPGAAPGFGLHTTSPDGDEVELRLYLTPGERSAGQLLRFVVQKVDAGTLPIQVAQNYPLVLDLHGLSDGWIETPKLFVPGYTAQADGRAVKVRRSPDGLVMVPIEAQTRRVELAYTGPLAVRIAAWLSLSAWVALLTLPLSPLGWRIFTRARTLSRRHAQSALRAGQWASVSLLVALAAMLLLHLHPQSAWARPAGKEENLELVLPCDRIGHQEILGQVLHASQTADLVLDYLDGQSLRVDLRDRQGNRLAVSEPIPVNYLVRQQLLIDSSVDDLSPPRLIWNDKWINFLTPPSTVKPSGPPGGFTGKVRKITPSLQPPRR